VGIVVAGGVVVAVDADVGGLGRVEEPVVVVVVFEGVELGF
jgi:hypothetical protein